MDKHADAKFDENAHNGLVSITFPYMPIVILPPGPPKSIGLVLS